MEKNRDTLCGRMSQEPFPATKEKTSESSLKQSCKPKTKPLQYLDRRSGTDPAVSWQTLSLLRGEHSTLSIGEYPKEERESTLSQILMVNVPEKYFLSKKACEGILQRASKSGKTLPKVLEEALT